MQAEGSVAKGSWNRLATSLQTGTRRRASHRGLRWSWGKTARIGKVAKTLTNM